MPCMTQIFRLKLQSAQQISFHLSSVNTVCQNLSTQYRLASAIPRRSKYKCTPRCGNRFLRRSYSRVQSSFRTSNACCFLLLTTPCWCRLLLSFYSTCERSTRMHTNHFWQGGPILAAKFGPPGPIFTLDQNFRDRSFLAAWFNRFSRFQQHFGPNMASETISECLILLHGGACPPHSLAYSHLSARNGHTHFKIAGSRRGVFFWTHFRLSLQRAIHMRMRSATPSASEKMAVCHLKGETTYALTRQTDSPSQQTSVAFLLTPVKLFSIPSTLGVREECLLPLLSV